MLFLFSSDDDLRQAQRAARAAKGATLTAEELRREAFDDAREIREHTRWRQFAFLLFVAPVIASILTGIVFWTVVNVVIGRLLPRGSIF